MSSVYCENSDSQTNTCTDGTYVSSPVVRFTRLCMTSRHSSTFIFECMLVTPFTAALCQIQVSMPPSIIRSPLFPNRPRQSSPFLPSTHCLSPLRTPIPQQKPILEVPVTSSCRATAWHTKASTNNSRPAFLHLEKRDLHYRPSRT